VDRVDADLREFALDARDRRAGGAGVAGGESAALDFVVLVDQRGGEGLVDRPLHTGVVVGLLEVRLQVLAGLGVVVAGEYAPLGVEVDLAPDGVAVGLVGRYGGGVVPVVRLEVFAADFEDAVAIVDEGVGTAGRVQGRQ